MLNDAGIGISVVTPCFNMVDFVEATVLSVINQKTDRDEYIFIDGNSTDGSFDLVSRYAGKIDQLICEPDDGQYHAISKGFNGSTCEIMAWLNADDVFMPWTFSVVREIFEKFPDVNWITGSPSFLNVEGQLTRIFGKIPAYPARYIQNGWFQSTYGAFLQQESMFWRRGLWERAGGLDLKYTLAADFELWTRFAEHAELVPIDIPLAAFRERPGEQRSSAGYDRYQSEVDAVCSEKATPPALWRMVSSRGIVMRSLARSLVSSRGPAIIYDRRRRTWSKVTRRRTIGRISNASLYDEWLLH